ncbi:MAG: hypothetical protein FWD69_01860 [Polyangiaceae bacterium]|nr:hypothetical protein [Polyangiaceae bacterium]
MIAFYSGWIATMALAAAAILPMVFRFRARRRARPSSPIIRQHVALGFLTSALAFGHTIVVLPVLGSPAATGGGMMALAPAGVAFFFLVAHAGLGLQLRDERLKERTKKRRAHAVTAAVIMIAITIHVVALERASR